MHPWHDSYLDDAQIATAFPVVIDIPKGSTNKIRARQGNKIVAVSIRDPAFSDYFDHAQLPVHVMRQLRRFFEDYKVLEHKQVPLPGLGLHDASCATWVLL